MRSLNRLPFILLATIILTVSCKKAPLNGIYPASFPKVQGSVVDGHAELATGLDQQRFEEINQVLGMIEEGRSTLQLIEAYQIRVHFEPGAGSRFIPSSNKIVIDSRFGHFSAALILVHEVTHARYYHEGLAADIKLHSRQAYAQMKTEEEMVAAIHSILATKELSEAGVRVVKLQHALYYPYQQAYGTAVRSARSDYPGVDEVTLQSIGQAAGRAVVRSAFLDGQVVNSITHQTYIEYWGSIWDSSNVL
jgi:hypothetical protein